MSIGNSVMSGVGTVAGSTVTGVGNIGQHNSNNFDAVEIQRQADRLKEQSDILLIKLKSAQSICEDISAAVKSEDSNLASSWKKLGDTFENIRKKYDGALSTMIERMSRYAAKSIVNENVIEKAANAVGNALDEVASFLQNIDL